MKKGITVVELLMAITIIAILMMAFSAIYSTGLSRLRRELAQTQLQTDAQTLLDRILTEVKEAGGVEQVFEDKSLSSTYLPLKIPAIDTSQNIIYSGSSIINDRVVYELNGNVLTRKVVAHPNSQRYSEDAVSRTLDRDVSSLNFTYLPDPSSAEQVNVVLTVSRKVGNDFKTVTVSGGAKFRNNL